MSRCSACQAPIVWAITEANGRPIPLDAEPDPTGNIIMTGRTSTDLRGRESPIVRVLGSTGDLFAPADEERWMPHFQSCPNVEEFRR